MPPKLILSLIHQRCENPLLLLLGHKPEPKSQQISRHSVIVVVSAFFIIISPVERIAAGLPL